MVSELYAGVGPSIARASLVSGSRFLAYEGAVALCLWSGFLLEIESTEKKVLGHMMTNSCLNVLP
jgi:hypothetical protein